MNFVSCFIDVAYNYYYTIMMIILLYIYISINYENSNQNRENQNWFNFRSWSLMSQMSRPYCCSIVVVVSTQCAQFALITHSISSSAWPPTPTPNTILSKLFKKNPSFAWLYSYWIWALVAALLLLNCIISLYFFVYSFFFRIVEENTENCRRRDQGLGQVGASNNNTSRERERERNRLSSTFFNLHPI